MRPFRSFTNLRRARGQGFVVARTGDTRWLRHWDHCQRERVPFIRVLPRIRYGDVEVDLPRGQTFTDAEICQAGLILIWFGSKRSLRDWTPTRLAVTGVPLEQIPNLLGELIYFLCGCQIRWAIEQKQ